MFKKFSYRSLEDLKSDIKGLGIDLPISDDFEIFKKPVDIGGKRIPNSMCAHPMESGDSVEDGGPSELTFRKYERVASGGLGLIWIEAVSVCEEGRSNKRQLFLNDKSLSGFKELVNRIHKAAGRSVMAPENPVIIMQLNHSGRYSKPYGKKEPIIASHKTDLDEKWGIDSTYPLVTDDYLDSLVEMFVKSSVLAKEAGFEGVDVKACHGYLLHELLSCFNREGKYGGSFENRIRLMLHIIDEIRKAIPDPNFIISTRINLYDAFKTNRGFGIDANDNSKVDMTESIMLTRELVKRGVTLINTTMGNPYYIPHINRPYDLGVYYPEETPLEGNWRLIKHTAELQKEFPEAQIVGVGYSWFREFSPYVAAGVLKSGMATLIGYGRQIFAYPDFYNDLVKQGRLNKSKVCVTCSKCSYLKRDIGLCGCPIRDAETYMPYYQDTYGRDVL